MAGALSAFSLVFLGGVFAKIQARDVTTATTNNVNANVGEHSAAQATFPMPIPASVNAQTAPSTRISNEQAEQIAQNAQPSARLQGQAELVRYAGRLAYEVPFVQGKIYVNADNGTILGNSMARVETTPQSTRPSREHSSRDQYGDEADEHEDREHRKKRGEHKKYEDDEHDNEEREDA